MTNVPNDPDTTREPTIPEAITALGAQLDVVAEPVSQFALALAATSDRISGYTDSDQWAGLDWEDKLKIAAGGTEAWDGVMDRCSEILGIDEPVELGRWWRTNTPTEPAAPAPVLAPDHAELVNQLAAAIQRAETAEHELECARNSLGAVAVVSLGRIEADHRDQIIGIVTADR